jgi:hypothetical protein
MTSIYRWEENVEVASEQLLIIKTTHFIYPELEIAIRNVHPLSGSGDHRHPCGRRLDRLSELA